MTGNSTNRPQISIVVPVFNEICIIETFVAHLKSQWKNPQELIIVDGGSKDGTWEWLQKNVTKAVQTQCRRANQMNIGVTRATSNNLFFLHADSRVPIHFDALLIEAQKKGSNLPVFSFNLTLKIGF